LILPLNFRPSGSGTSTMSRGIEIIDTVWATGSRDATIIVSVRYVFRPIPASTPTSSTFWRATAGDGEADGPMLGAPGNSDGRVTSGSGTADADPDGSHAPAVVGSIGMI
jgi:hypothetical protein